MNTRRTHLEVTIAGKNITEDIAHLITRFSYTDNLGGSSDLAELTLADVERLFTADWFPQRGDTCDIAIVKENFPDSGTLQLNSFEVDEVENSFPPNTCRLKLNSLANNAQLRSIDQSKCWEKVTLKKIAGDIAGEAGLELFFDSNEDPTIERAEQKEQTKLAFLEKLCSDNGLALKVNDKKLIIFDEEKYEQQSPVTTFTYGDEKIKSFTGRATISKIYKACHVKYQQGKKKEFIEHTYTDESKSEGMTLEINKKVESKAEAERLAKKELRKKNREEIKVNLEVVGSFEYLAGNVVELDDSFGFYAGNYLIEKAHHEVGSGYSCRLDLRKCLVGY